MVLFYKSSDRYYAVKVQQDISKDNKAKLSWLFGNATFVSSKNIEGVFIGPRKEMITPWSTNAVEISQNMGIEGIERIEEFVISKEENPAFDPMLQVVYSSLDQKIFNIDTKPEPVIHIEDIKKYNASEGLALSDDEVEYLQGVSEKINRPLTDGEVYGFAQVNSEHCRHKIFNGTFIIDGVEKKDSLFSLIKKTSAVSPKNIVSAYKDNVAFVIGPKVEQFAPASQDKADFFEVRDINTVLSLKAETHNFPTTVEPFNGAATGTGGEIRDRMAGGKGSMPVAGTAVYMTSYPRTEENRIWEKNIQPRKWLYQSPEEILIKASNGASDFGNKFGQPLICGSVLTFEHEAKDKKYGYDKVIMQAGGVGFARKDDALKDKPEVGDIVVLLGGDNYRIGMGGGAVSSVSTGEFGNQIELNAVQRSNPEMQKRVANAIRAMAEAGVNPIVSIHDHGAGGHLNSLSELVEETGGKIDLNKLPVGDPTLSAKEIIGNESQERMGLIMKEKDYDLLERVAQRERAPIYNVGKTTGDMKFTFEDTKSGVNPIDLDLEYMFGKPPRTVLEDTTQKSSFEKVTYTEDNFEEYLENVLQIEAVACKDWLTNKVDRSVTGKIAHQQCAGPLQLPLNDVAVVALDYRGVKGMATSLGHAPVSALIDPAKGSRLSIAESLTNLVWANLTHGIKDISLSANWMWPAKNPGENYRLYEGVKAISDFAVALGINIPTGKDSLSMTQKYDKEKVYAPGTVIISSIAEVEDIKKTVSPVVKNIGDNELIYVDFSADEFTLGGSSFAQIVNKVGDDAPDVKDVFHFKRAFRAVQELIHDELVTAGHDISAGGMITTLLEMLFADNKPGMNIDISALEEKDIIKVLFSENPGVIMQVRDAKKANRNFVFPSDFNGKPSSYNINPDRRAKSNLNAAIIREKGVNGDREMAYSLYLAGFDVKDVHMTDLISGRETLEDVNMIVFVGGFSNSDVLGSAKGWAGAFLYNPKAKETLDKFYARNDTLSLGICNGCQLMMELGLINQKHAAKPKMLHNDSHKFESNFITVDIPENDSVMLKSLGNTKLGVWIAHGEGKFKFPYEESKYNIVAKYSYNQYPGNPNGSNYNAAALCSDDGRHLAMMPHLERSIMTWQWAYYPERKDEVTPWIEAFVNAKKWIEKLK